MALGFGRKNGADDAPETADVSGINAANTVPEAQASLVAPHAPSSPPNDVLDAFDLDTFAIPTVDTSESAPNLPANAHAATAGSAFDFPLPDIEVIPTPETEIATPPAPIPQMAAPQITAPASQMAMPEMAAPMLATPVADEPATLDLDDLFFTEQEKIAANAPKNAPAPFVPAGAAIEAEAPPFYETQVPVAVETPVAAKRKLPLLPILGAVLLLGLGGGAAYVMSQGTPESEDAPLIAPARPVAAPPVAARPAAPAVQPVAPTVKVVQIERVPVVVKPLPGSANKVRPGISPVSTSRNQLKALWKRGADAKHRGDYSGARRYWNQGLKIEPTNVGFKESISKLPR